MKLYSLLLIISLISCKTMKIDSSGNKNPTANTKHIDKVNNYHGFWTGKGYVNSVTKKP